MKIGLIVGSLRKDSWNKKIANVSKELLNEVSGIEADLIDFSYLPFYNEDLDKDNEIEEYKLIRETIKSYDSFIFFTPEYNRSYAPAIKNVIDVVSKDPRGNGWKKKPAAVFSSSTGGFGGMAGNHALRNSFIAVDLIAMQQPEVYLSKVDTLFDDNGQMVESTKTFLNSALMSFIDHSNLVLAK